MASLATTAITTSLFSSLLRKPTLSLYRTLPRITCSSSLQFNISFAPAKPKKNLSHLQQSQDDEDDVDFGGGSQQLFIPWIVRGEDGNLKLQMHPPERLIHTLADAKTQKSAKKKKDEKKESGGVKAAKLSKAARRFYNENFRDPPERLSKVLAAAGGIVFVMLLKKRLQIMKCFCVEV